MSLLYCFALQVCTLRFDALLALQELARDWLLLGFGFCCDVRPRFCLLLTQGGSDVASVLRHCLCLVLVSGKICLLPVPLGTISHGEMPRSNASALLISSIV